MKKMLRLISLSLVLIFSLVACGTETQNKTAQNYSSSQSDQMLVEEANSDQSVKSKKDKTESQTNTETPSDRYLIYTASLEYETLEFQNSKETIYKIIQDHKGQIQYENENQLSSSYSKDKEAGLKNLDLQIRLPQVEFEKAYKALQDLESAKLLTSNQGSEDVTQSVTDLDIRIKAVEDRIDRLNELLKKAELVEDLIRLQQEIETAIVERDQYLAQKAHLEDQVAMSTINISLRERLVIEEASNVKYSFTDRVSRSFSQALVGTRRLLENIVIHLIDLIPLLVALLIGLLIYFILIRPIAKQIKLRQPTKVKENKMKPEKNEKADQITKTDDESSDSNLSE